MSIWGWAIVIGTVGVAIMHLVAYLPDPFPKRPKFDPTIPSPDPRPSLIECWSILRDATAGSSDAATALDTLREEIGKLLMPLDMPAPQVKGAKR